MGRPVGTVKSWRARGRERLRRRLIRSGLAPAAGPGALLASTPRSRGRRSADPRWRGGPGPLGRPDGRGSPGGGAIAGQRSVQGHDSEQAKDGGGVICALAFLAAGLGTAARVAAEGPKKPGDQARSETAPSGRRARKLRPSLPPAPATRRPDLAADAPRGRPHRPGQLRRSVRVLSGRPGGSGPTPIRATPGPGERRPADDLPGEPRRRRPAVQGRSHGPWSGRSSSDTGTCRSSTCSSGPPKRLSSLPEEILEREQAEQKVGRGTEADVAEAQQRLEQFRLNVVTQDVGRDHRRAAAPRDILGLPPADNRRIVPVSVPVEAKVDPDWDACRWRCSRSSRNRPGEGEGSSDDPDRWDRPLTGRAGLPAGPRPARRALTPPVGPAGAKPAVPESASLQQLTHQATPILRPARHVPRARSRPPSSR